MVATGKKVFPECTNREVWSVGVRFERLTGAALLHVLTVAARETCTSLQAHRCTLPWEARVVCEHARSCYAALSTYDMCLCVHILPACRQFPVEQFTLVTQTLFQCWTHSSATITQYKLAEQYPRMASHL